MKFNRTADGGLPAGIVDAAPFCVFWKDIASVYLGCNKMFAEYAGLSDPSDIVGKTDKDLVWKEYAHKYQDDDRAVVTEGVSLIDMEERGLVSSGKEVWWSTSKVPLRDAHNRIIGLVGYIEDISELIRIREQNRRINRAMDLQHRCIGHIVSAENETMLLNELCRLIVDVGYAMAWIGHIGEPPEKSIVPLAQAGTYEGYLESLHVTWDDVPLGRGPTGSAVRNRGSVVNQNVLTNPAMVPWREAAVRQGFQSSIAIPLMYSDEMLAVMTIYAKEPDAFDQAEVDLLEELARSVSVGIDAMRQRQRRVKTLEQVTEALTSTIELRDPYTTGHEKRTADLAVAIALDLNLSTKMIDGLRTAALLHDIGKIRVPIEILTNPRRLEPAEYALIKVHPDIGYEILRKVDFPWPVADIVRQHHERLDGSGYPLGLKGEEILLESRIIAVADVVEAMSSARPYRAALGIESALTEIEGKKGVLYDSVVVDACLRLIRDQHFRFE